VQLTTDCRDVRHSKFVVGGRHVSDRYAPMSGGICGEKAIVINSRERAGAGVVVRLRLADGDLTKIGETEVRPSRPSSIDNNVTEQHFYGCFIGATKRAALPPRQRSWRPLRLRVIGLNQAFLNRQK
jgi:hypothetical protein